MKSPFQIGYNLALQKIAGLEDLQDRAKQFEERLKELEHQFEEAAIKPIKPASQKLIEENPYLYGEKVKPVTDFLEKHPHITSTVPGSFIFAPPGHKLPILAHGFLGATVGGLAGAQLGSRISDSNRAEVWGGTIGGTLGTLLLGGRRAHIAREAAE